MLHTWDYVLIGMVATLAGTINALAGGGTLFTFPVLTAVGLPAIVANVTNTLGLLPGTIGGTLAQWEDLKTQARRLILFLPAAMLGGLAGGFLLLNTGEKLFRQIVPFLILLASLLLVAQDQLRAMLIRRSEEHAGKRISEFGVILPVGLAAVYGGYFGAGLGVILLATLGLTLDDSLTKLNALKQGLSFGANSAAAVFFVLSSHVVWPVALVMAICALFGGWLGGRLAGKIKPSSLRWIVAVIGMLVSVVYFIRG